MPSLLPKVSLVHFHKHIELNLKKKKNRNIFVRNKQAKKKKKKKKKRILVFVSMEGLIPYLFNVLKKEKPKHSYRSFSENSTSQRSYHRLLSGSSHNLPEGSSHRRTRSEFQPPPPPPPASLDFSEQLRSRSYSRGFPSPSDRNRSGSSYPNFLMSNFDNDSSGPRRRIASK